MKNIGFIGLGLIGGSIVKALRRVHPDYHILACSRSRAPLEKALSEGLIDGICESTDPELLSCDYLFLCTPVEYNLVYLERVSGLLGEGCIITDVGSVKGDIHRRAMELSLGPRFIGGHPMAGSEKSGFDYSSDRLLENAWYILTPGDGVPLQRLSEFEELVSSIGAIPMILTPEEHDFITAGVSHLPHIIAFSLVNLVHALDDEACHMKTIAAGGFRDITRIASSSPEMWQQICLENQENISRVLDEYIRLLVNVRCRIDNRERDFLYQMFADARDYRDSFDVHDQGLLKKSHCLYLDLVDEAGSIATIATILATDKISIKNIGIIHNREFEQGVLKIAFYEEEAMNRAAALLEKQNYNIYQR